MNKLFSTTSNSDRDKVFIKKLVEIITLNLENSDFEVKELAEASGMSSKTLNRKLKAINGKTIAQFIREVRLLKALEMLQNNEITASEVSYKVGFSSPTYFNTCFHEFFGYTPGTVKKSDSNVSGKLNNGYFTKARLQKRVPRRTIIYVAAGFVLLTMLVYTGYNIFFKSGYSASPEPAGNSEKSIAVLPFKNLSDDSSNQYFIDGVMEEILTSLSRIHDLRVVSRTSVEQFRKGVRSTFDIGKKLNVGYLVEGSGQKYGNKFVLRVQLITVLNDRHLWAGSYEQEISETSDIISIQSQVAQSIAAELKTTLTPEEKSQIEKTPTSNLTAYDFYQRGKDEYNKFIIDNYSKGINRAKELFDKALELDSTFALAYIGLADIYTNKHYHETYFSKNYLDSVLILADRALSFDDHLSEAYAHKGFYYLHIGKTEQAIKEIEKALEYNPNNWKIYSSFGWNVYFLNHGSADYVKGIEYLQKAVNINRGKELPDLLRDLGSGYIWAGFPEKSKFYNEEAFKLDGDTTKYMRSLAGEAFLYGNYEKDAEVLRKCYERDSANVFLTWLLAFAYSNSNQNQEALKFVKKIENRLDAGNFFSSMGSIGYVYWQNGYKKEAELWFNKQKRMSEESLKMGRFYSIDANNDLAMIYAFMGDKEKAYENLKIVSGMQVCPLWMLSLFKRGPMYNNIRSEPEFQRIVSNLESKYQAEHERVMKWLAEQGQL